MTICLLRFRSARLSDMFDEVGGYGENRNIVLPEREDYEVTLDAVAIGNNFLVPAVSVHDSVVGSHVCITFGTSGLTVPRDPELAVGPPSEHPRPGRAPIGTLLRLLMAWMAIGSDAGQGNVGQPGRTSSSLSITSSIAPSAAQVHGRDKCSVS